MKRKITAILAADIAGYSRLISEDEEETLRRLTDYQRLFKDQINEAGGRVFKTAGDSVLAEFPSAVDALRTAVTVQESLRIRNQAYPASRQMAYRIGLTIGDVVDQDGDLLGDSVNIAARLETLAQPGGICVSKAMHDAVSSKLTVGFKDMGLQTVKNIPAPVHVYSVAQDRQPAASARVTSIAGFSLNSVLAGLAVASASAAVVWMLQRPADTPAPPASTVTSAPAVETPAMSAAERTPSSTSDSTAPPSISAPEAPNSETAPPPAAAESAPAETDKPADTAAPAAVKEDLASATRLRPIRWSACRSDDTSAALQACGALAGDLGIAAESRAEAQRRLGYAQRKSGDVDAALKSLSDSIDVVPTSVAYNDRGTTYLIKGDSAKAFDDYDAAIKLDPKNGEAWNNRAWMLYKAGDNRKALEDANQAVKYSADKAYVWDTRGHIHEALGSRKAAEADFLKAVTIDPQLSTSQSALKRLIGR